MNNHEIIEIDETIKKLKGYLEYLSTFKTI